MSPFFLVALAEIDDHARVRVFAEEIRVLGLEFLHRLVEFGFGQFGSGFHPRRATGPRLILPDKACRLL